MPSNPGDDSKLVCTGSIFLLSIVWEIISDVKSKQNKMAYCSILEEKNPTKFKKRWKLFISMSFSNIRTDGYLNIPTSAIFPEMSMTTTCRIHWFSKDIKWRHGITIFTRFSMNCNQSATSQSCSMFSLSMQRYTSVSVTLNLSSPAMGLSLYCI